MRPFSAARRRSVGFAALLFTALAASGCSALKASKESRADAELLAGITVRAPDAFYDPPASVPRRPGALLRSEALRDVKLPAGMRGWRILYTTSVDDHTPATAVATVFAPAAYVAGPRPVITWAHGTTGLLQKCMPSLVSSPSEGIPARDRIVANGWVVVATDYSFAEKGGPHPYLIGQGEARALLDSVRAARYIPELTLDKRTVVWGHSQGGHSALWAGIAGQRYAPDVEILGVVGIAPAADIKSIIAMNPAVDKRLGPYLARSYSRFYQGFTFEQALKPEALAAALEIENLCGFLPPTDPKRIAAVTTSFDGPALALATNKKLAARLAENAASYAIAAPIVIAQGLSDAAVPPLATDTYVDERCAAGQRIEYWRFAGRNHATIVRPGTPLEEPIIAWTAARFAGEPQAAGCSRKSF